MQVYAMIILLLNTFSVGFELSKGNDDPLYRYLFLLPIYGSILGWF